jgi:hypothetical protein
MKSLFHWFSVVTVSLYLLVVYAYLLVARRILKPPFRRLWKAYFDPPFEGELNEFKPVEGHCYSSPLPKELLSDRESISWLRVFENDQPLPLAHSLHGDIIRSGQGRFSHWGEALFFSSTDQSNPMTNGRRYRVVEKREGKPRAMSHKP